MIILKVKWMLIITILRIVFIKMLITKMKIDINKNLNSIIVIKIKIKISIFNNQ